MGIEEIKIQAAALREYYDRLPMPDALREKALVVYTKKTLLDLETALLNPEKVENPLEDFLNRNWALVNGTALAPTVIPDADITKLLCDVAMVLADDKNKAHPDELTTPHQLLMPTVTIDSLRDEYQNLNEIPLSTVLKTHILGRKGEFLLPVKLLTELDLSPEAIHLNNPYTPMMTEDATLYQVAPEEYARLVGHSPLTQAVGDAKQQYDLLANDKSTLLGQLSELCSKLGIYSVTGLGTETHAAAGAYAPIIVFNDYYNQLDETQKGAIPAPLKNEIDKLLNLSSNPEANINATENIETCIATRRSALMEHMRGHETSLDHVSVSGARKESLLGEADARFKTAVAALENVLETKTHEGGYDHLSLNRQLLSELGLAFTVSSSQDLNVFKALSADEMSELLESPELAAQIIGEIGNLENLVVFILDLSSEKTSAFLNGTQQEVTRQFIGSPQDLGALLVSLDVEKCTAVCQGMKSELPNIIKTGRRLCAVLQHLSTEQCAVIIDAIKSELPKMIMAPGGSSDLFRRLTPEQRSIVFDAIKSELPNMIKTVMNLRDLLEYLAPEQCAVVYAAMKDDLPNIIKTCWDVGAALLNLPPGLRTDVYDSMKSELPKMIKADRDLRGVLEYLSPAQCSAVIDTIKIDLPKIIGTAKNLGDLMRCLTPEQNAAMMHPMKSELPNIIKNGKDFENVLRRQPPELQAAILGAMKSELPNIIATYDDLGALMQHLSPAQCSAVIDTMKSGSPNMIANWNFGRELQYLTAAQSMAVIDALKSELPKMIKTGKKLGDILEKLDLERCGAVIDALKIDLPKIIKTAPDLNDVFQDLHPLQCAAVIDAMGSQILTLEPIYGSKPTPSDELNNIIAFIKNAPKTEPAKLFASAVIDNDVEKIKTSFARLAEEPMEALAKDINTLAPKWKDKIKSALGLSGELSEETLCGLLRQHTASKESNPSSDFKSRLQDLNPKNVEEALKKNLTQYINEQSTKDISQGDGVEIEAAKKLIKHLEGEAQIFNASEKEYLTQGLLGELIKKCPEIMDTIQRHEAAPR